MRASQAVAAGLLSPFGAGFPAGALLGDEPQGAAFDFLNMDMVIRGGGFDWQGGPNSKLTYTSPSTKWVRNAAGVYVSGTTLRCDHLADGTALGLLIEGQFTNVLPYSQQFDNAAWVKADTTITADATTSADGTVNADLFTEGSVGNASTYRNGAATSASASVVGSIFLKRGNTDWVRVILGDDVVTTGADVWVNLATGALGSVTTRGTSTNNSATIEAASNGFYRVKIRSTFQAGVTNIRLQINSAASDGSGTRVNNATYYAWQADAGLGSAIGSPVVTTTAAVTRAADNISIALSLLPFDVTKGTMLAKIIPNSIATGSYQTMWLREDGNNYISLFRSAASRQAAVTVGGVAQASLASGSAVVGTASKSALSWKANDFAFSAGGGTIQTDTSGSLPTPATLYLGSANGGVSHLEGWLQQLIYLPRDMSDSELVAWST